MDNRFTGSCDFIHVRKIPWVGNFEKRTERLFEHTQIRKRGHPRPMERVKQTRQRNSTSQSRIILR